MKNKLFSILLSVVLILGLSVTAYGVTIEFENDEGDRVKLNDFLDTKGHWAHDTILKCAEYELVSGYKGNFMPNSPIIRGDLAVVIDRMLNLEITTYNTFYDLPNDSYYRDAILRCYSAGYITGVSTNEVSPRGYATREQVAVIICRMFEIDTSYYGYTSFVDDKDISAWAKPSVAAMQRLGYMVGDNAKKFNPKANITRAELLTLINNVANTYIPRRDANGQGSEFRGSYPTNIVTCRNITLTNSNVGRDLVIAPSCTSIDLVNTVVKGRLLIMDKTFVTLDSSTVSQVRLMDGKSTVDGISENIHEVYVEAYASESSLDGYPTRLVLEPGVRVDINGEMYENNSNVTKTYYGDELKADLAAEQGYIIGGAKISGESFEQDYENTISVKNIKITVGDSKIKEVGVVWLEQYDDEDIISPSYQNYDGKKVYNSNKIAEPFGFDVGKVKNTCAYRVYAIDEDGLFAYGDTYVFTSYDFNINLKVLENDYPKKVDVELVMTGDSIPEISNIRVVHDRYETYSEEHEQENMKLYTDDDAEYQPDTNKYKRYTATITSDSERDSKTNEYIYYPPTAFGYIITFKDGTIINRFPVITNAIPAGVKPVTSLTLGNVHLGSNGYITVDNTKLVTSYVAVQEVGVVYKESEANSVASPNNSSVGWTQIKGGYDILSNNSYTFDSTIKISDESKNTFIAPYVKTSNGYYYGDVSKVENDWRADEEGYVLKNVQSYVLGDGEVLFIVETESGYLSPSDWVSLGDSLGMHKLSTLEYKEYDEVVYFVVRGLDLNKYYNIPFRVYKDGRDDARSNVYSINFTTTVPFSFANKRVENGDTIFTLNSSKAFPHSWTLWDADFTSGTEHISVAEGTFIKMDESVNTTSKQVDVVLTYRIAYGSSLNIEYDFNMTLDLY